MAANTGRSSKTESKPEEFGVSVFTPTSYITISSHHLAAKEDRSMTHVSFSSETFSRTVFVTRFRMASPRKERVDFHLLQLERFSIRCRSSAVVLERSTSLLPITPLSYPDACSRSLFCSESKRTDDTPVDITR